MSLLCKNVVCVILVPQKQSTSSRINKLVWYVWIGSKKYSEENNCSELNFQWTTQFKRLGIYYDVDLDKIIKLNYDKKLVQIKSIIEQWSKRHLTPIGRITLVKSLLISQLNHLFIALPNPKSNALKELNNILFNFVWNSKCDKIKRHVLKGMNMVG